MPDGFEYVIRPYQTPGSLTDRVIPATPRGTRERAHLVWGGKGTMPAIKMLYPSTKVNICKEGLTEKPDPKRESDIVRIEQPGKPENYVDVARAKTITLDKVDQNKTDQSFGTTASVPQKLDPKLDAYGNQFTQPGTNAFPDFKGSCLVTWNLRNDPA